MTAATILIVDDEPAIRRLLRGALIAAGYRTIEASSAVEAMAALDPLPALVLLDLGLPDRDGLELIPAIQKRGRVPVVVVSARDATAEKVAALDLGADDYVTKPFDTDELLARVRAGLRHEAGMGGASVAVRRGGVSIDLVDRVIRRNGGTVHLTPKEYGVLAELARFPGRAITHRHLLKTVWPRDRDGHVEYLRMVVRSIRQKLEEDPANPTLIVNDPGVGYRLLGDNEA